MQIITSRVNLQVHISTKQIKFLKIHRPKCVTHEDKKKCCLAKSELPLRMSIYIRRACSREQKAMKSKKPEPTT